MTPRPAGRDALGLMLRDLERWVLVGIVGACVAGGSLVLVVGLLAALLAVSLASFAGGLPGLGLLPGLAGSSSPAARVARLRAAGAGRACLVRGRALVRGHRERRRRHLHPRLQQT